MMSARPVKVYSVLTKRQELRNRSRSRMRARCEKADVLEDEEELLDMATVRTDKS